jgi:hypothetical protein
MPDLNKQFGRYAFLLAMSVLVALLVPVAGQTTAQVQQGATMTVLAGQVAVIRTDGSAVQPAASGTDVFPGDEIRTLTRSGALITFFAGTEIELGAETILVVQSVSRPGDRVDITLRQVAGTSVSRVHTFIDAGGGYRVEAGGAVALVRGSELGVLGPRDGIVVFINFESSVPIVVHGCFLSPGVGVWLQVEPDGRGGWRVISDCHEFRANLLAGPWNALEEGFTTGQQDAQGDTRKRPAGQVPGGQVQQIASQLDKKKDDDEAVVATTTVLAEALTTTTRTTTAPVTVTTGATSTTVTTLTDSQTTTVPLTTTTTVTEFLTEATTSTTTIVTTSESVTTTTTSTTTTRTVAGTTVTFFCCD